MTLWTPNPRTVDPVRVCPRCEGFIVDQDHKDMRRYLSLHRICCCSEIDCNDYCVQVTFSGVDASVCSSDCEAFSGSSSEDDHAVTLDGTYTPPPYPFYPSKEFIYISATTGEFRTATRYTTGDCTGSGASVSSTGNTVDVSTTCTDGVVTITLVSASASTTSEAHPGGANIVLFHADSLSASPGDTINNAASCGADSGAICDGGTAVVTLVSC